MRWMGGHLPTMRTTRQMTLDFLERQRDLDDRSTFQLYLIIETMTSLIEDKDLQEILTTFKNLKQCTEQ